MPEARLTLRATEQDFEVFDEANRSLGQIEDAARRTTETGERGFSNFQAAVVTFNQALELTQTIARGVGQALDFALFEPAQRIDALQKQADAIGVNVQQLSQLTLAANLSGTSMEALGQGMVLLAQRMEQAEVSAASLGARGFAALGISLDQLRQQDAAGQLELVAEAVERLGVNSQTVAALANVFGVSLGPQLIPFLRLGREGIQQLRDEADLLGITFDELTGRQMERFNDSITRVETAVDGLQQQLATTLAPVLAPLIEDFARWVAINREFLTQNISAVIDDAAQAIRTLSSTIAGNRETLEFWLLVLRIASDPLTAGSNAAAILGQQLGLIGGTGFSFGGGGGFTGTGAGGSFPAPPLAPVSVLPDASGSGDPARQVTSFERLRRLTRLHIEQVSEARQEMEALNVATEATATTTAELQTNFINVGEQLAEAVASSTTAFLFRRQDPVELLTGTGIALGSQLFQGLVAEKLNFDALIKRNFLEDFPQIFSESARSLVGFFRGGFDEVSSLASGAGDSIRGSLGAFGQLPTLSGPNQVPGPSLIQQAGQPSALSQIFGAAGIAAAVGGLVFSVLDIAGVFQKAPVETLSGEFFSNAFRDQFLPQAPIPGVTSGNTLIFRSPQAQLPVSDADRAFFESIGLTFPGTANFPVPSGITLRPDTSALRQTTAFTTAALVPPGQDASGVTGLEIGGAANLLATNFAALGIPPEEANRLFRQFLSTQGISTFGDALQGLNTQFLQGNLSVEGVNVALEGAVELFARELPEGIDVAALAMRRFNEEAGGLNIAGLTGDIERAQIAVGLREQAADIRFGFLSPTQQRAQLLRDLRGVQAELGDPTLSDLERQRLLEEQAQIGFQLVGIAQQTTLAGSGAFRRETEFGLGLVEDAADRLDAIGAVTESNTEVTEKNTEQLAEVNNNLSVLATNGMDLRIHVTQENGRLAIDAQSDEILALILNAMTTPAFQDAIRQANDNR